MTINRGVKKPQNYGLSSIMLPFCLSISTAKAVVPMGSKLYSAIVFAVFASVR